MLVRILSVCALALATLFAGCDVETACTEVACNDGVEVQFTLVEPGTYDIRVTVDGVETTCSATLPLPQSPPEACDEPGVYLMLSGSELDPSQHAIGGVLVASTTATTLSIGVTRDGTVVAQSDFTVTYEVTPGPNGPDCEPKECRHASLELMD